MSELNRKCPDCGKECHVLWRTAMSKMSPHKKDNETLEAFVMACECGYKARPDASGGWERSDV